jgi:hypothetical protein
MSLLEDVGTLIDSSSATLTLGTNLFLGRLPDSPDTCVAVYQYGGEAPFGVMGGDSMPPVEQPRIQVVVRAAGYSTAETLSRTVWGYLETVLNETLSGTSYLRISAIQSPFPTERDIQERILFAQNFRVSKAL